MKNSLQSRKILLIVFAVLLILVGTLSIAYAALSTTLTIIGNAEVTAATWDIYLDNVELNSQSATTTLPTITDKTTASFSTTLTNPGDFYEFTIDVVNNGSIDAMIDSVTKTPALTDTQKKYLNYIVEYQNGEAISTKQLVSKNSSVRLKVRVEFRKDISSSDLPTSSETLNLSFIVNYVQSDETGTNVNNNGKIAKIISGDYDTVGSEIAIGDEHFYVISSDTDSVTMLAKYNLHVGNRVADSSYVTTPLENPTGIQDATTLGSIYDNHNPINFPWIGTVAFSSTNYWWNSSTNAYITEYPIDFTISEKGSPYVYDKNSNLYSFVQNYKIYLESLGVNIEEARIIKARELLFLGCDLTKLNCLSAPEWVYGTSYWSGTVYDNEYFFFVLASGGINYNNYSYDAFYGVRPVITVSKSEF